MCRGRISLSAVCDAGGKEGMAMWELCRLWDGSWDLRDSGRGVVHACDGTPPTCCRALARQREVCVVSATTPSQMPEGVTYPGLCPGPRGRGLLVLQCVGDHAGTNEVAGEIDTESPVNREIRGERARRCRGQRRGVAACAPGRRSTGVGRPSTAPDQGAQVEANIRGAARERTAG